MTEPSTRSLVLRLPVEKYYTGKGTNAGCVKVAHTTFYRLHTRFRPQIHTRYVLPSSSDQASCSESLPPVCAVPTDGNYSHTQPPSTTVIIISLCGTCHLAFDHHPPHWIMLPEGETIQTYIDHERNDYAARARAGRRGIFQPRTLMYNWIELDTHRISWIGCGR